MAALENSVEYGSELTPGLPYHYQLVMSVMGAPWEHDIECATNLLCLKQATEISREQKGPLEMAWPIPYIYT